MILIKLTRHALGISLAYYVSTLAIHLLNLAHSSQQSHTWSDQATYRDRGRNPETWHYGRSSGWSTSEGIVELLPQFISRYWH